MRLIAPVPPPAIRLEMFPAVPAWAIAHAVRDDTCAPLLRPGEVAVVRDERGTIPDDGGLYLIEYESPQPWGANLNPPPLPRRRQWIAQTCRSSRTDGGWYCHPYARPRTPAEHALCRQRGLFVASDGPYPDELALSRLVLGPVVGIYSPRIEGQAR